MPRKSQKTKTEYLQEIVDKYIKAGEPWPASRKTLAEWAIRNGEWSRERKSAVEQCAKELAEAMRLEMEQDPQGRTVRAKHCAKITEQDVEGRVVQKTLWFGRTDAPPELMKISFQQSRKQIVGICQQLKTDVDSWNDNNPYGAQHQLSLNFTPDVDEGNLDTEYNPPPAADEDDEDSDD